MYRIYWGDHSEETFETIAEAEQFLTLAVLKYGYHIPFKVVEDKGLDGKMLLYSLTKSIWISDNV